MTAERGAQYQRGPALRMTLDLHADLVRALDTWIATQRTPQPDRELAVTTALRDWLTGLGLLPHGDYSEGLH